MNCTPLISVLIPVYNVELFVFDAVRSICNQTYKNLEIIVVDDCSTDKTYDIIAELAKNDKRVRLYRNSKNLKIAETLNFALEQASGDFIARMDGDDFSESGKIEKQYLFLMNNPEYALVGTNYILEDEFGNEISRTHYLSDFSKISKVLRFESPVAHIWLTTKKVYNEIGGYRMPGVEDYDFLLRLVSKGYKISNLGEYLYIVRLRNGNTISTMGLEQRKAAQFSYKLFRERCSKNSNHDSYSVINYNLETTISKNKLSQFQKSAEYYNLFLKYRKIYVLKSIFFLLLSIYKSPNAQLKYIYKRFRLKIIKNHISL
jgi:glycosyltransferase involved in cell wall biosynthesis